MQWYIAGIVLVDCPTQLTLYDLDLSVEYIGGGPILKGVVKCLEPLCGREKTSGDDFFAKYTWFAHIN